ncbi:MAG: triose-phosphate isomerase [Firmicutes bacterium]|nr:triose-phosphate isomerase [Bacillota bacterium]
MKWIISNHKMNLSLEEIGRYVHELKTIKSNHQLVFCPSYLYIPYFPKDNYEVGAQNVSSQDNGALTGEVSAKQLKSMGVKYAIIGHSERRNKMFETDEVIREKLVQLLNNQICPILCIGEKEDELENKTEVLKRQIENAFLKVYELSNIIIAYEPVWAIGTGKVPTNEDIEKTVSFIKDFIKENYHIELPVLYGGSVSPSNIEELNQVNNIDGYLIGGTSLDLDKLKIVIEKTMEDN